MKKILPAIILVIITAGQTHAQSLRVHSGTCLRIDASSTLDLGTANLMLDSDSLSTATLLDHGNLTYSGGGETRVERFITPGQWHLISSPVANAEAGIFIGDFLQRHSEVTNQWYDITSLTTLLALMKGYSLWSTDSVSSRELFTGTSNTGTLQVNFTKGGNGFNLLGNPYPSAIDWNEVVIPAGLNGQFYLWDPTIGANGDYVYYIEGGGPANTTTQYIPSGQGFFVEANAPGVLLLDNSVRTHASQNFYKNSTAFPLIVLRVSGNGITTQTAVRLDPSATDAIDRLLDVRKILSGNADIPNLYSYSGTEKMAINTLASLSGNEMIPMGFMAGMNGTYTIRASELESLPENTHVLLEDPENGLIQDLKKQPEYSFTYSSGDEKPFRLHFKEATGFREPGLSSNPFLNCMVKDGQLRIRLDETIFPADNLEMQLSVYSITGQQLMKSAISGADHSIPFHLGPAVYLVSITTPKGVYTTKVVNP